MVEDYKIPKRGKMFFKYIRESNASVYCLQDTHCTEEDENVVYSQWGFDFLYSPGKTDSRGTLTHLIIILNTNCLRLR